MPPVTVERKIYFYRADIGRDNSGKPLPLDHVAAMQTLKDLPFASGAGGRYEEEPNGNVLCGLPSEGFGSMRFCRIRRVGLPQLERLGEIRDLDIDSDTGLMEPTHVVFFDKNVLGIEYNHFGPRASRLGTYLSRRVPERFPLVGIYPLLRHDISEQLESLNEIRLLEFRIHPAYISRVRQADESLADAFDANLDAFDETDSIQLILRASKDGRRSALNRFLEPIKQILGQHDLSENVHQFKVRGYRSDTGQVETIDLLSSLIVAAKQVTPLNPRSRALKASSVFNAIRGAYSQLAKEIEIAVAIEDHPEDAS